MDKSLEALQSYLNAARREVSAYELSMRLKCSLPTVYRRIRRLKEAGALIAEVKKPRGRTGPAPRYFSLVRGAKLS